jgi:hypothetical protein
MKNRILALALLLASSGAFAADIDGTWIGTWDSPGGAIMLSYTLKADGNVLTGTSAGPDGTAVPIKDGKIDGNKISFAIVVDFGGGPTTIPYTGVVSSPTELKLQFEMMGTTSEVLAKKSS